MENLLPFLFAVALLYWVRDSYNKGHVSGQEDGFKRHELTLKTLQIDSLKKEVDLKDKEYHLAKAIADFNALKNAELEKQLKKLDIERRALPFYVPSGMHQDSMVDGDSLAQKDAEPVWQDEVSGLGR